MWQEHISEVLAFIPSIGIAIAWMVREARNKEKIDREEAASEADRERAYSDRMEKRLRDKEKELEYALTQLMEAKLNNSVDPEGVLKDIIDHDPGLMFAKKRIAAGKFTMVRVSRGYAALYLGGPKEFYDGKDDSEIWGLEIGTIFNQNDETIYKSQIGTHIEEPIESKLTGIVGTFTGRKFPVRLGDTDYIIGIGQHVDRHD